jgi:transposase-like protein
MNPPPRARRTYSVELKKSAVQMLLAGSTVRSVMDTFDLSCEGLLRRWKKEYAGGATPSNGTASPPRIALDTRVRRLEEKLRDAQRNNDTLRKLLGIVLNAWGDGAVP